MKKLAKTIEEKKAIYQLQSMLINQSMLSPADIWKILSAPKAIQKFSKKKGNKKTEIKFNDQRVAAFKNLKENLKKLLEPEFIE